jgi:hypothetical protein
MSQVIFTPAAVYKWFRNLVQGHTGAGSEVDGFYIKQVIGTTIIKQIKYFKIGIGGPTVGGLAANDTTELTRAFYDANCKDKNGGYGDLNIPIHIYALATDGYNDPVGTGRDKKALAASNFYNYGNSNDSKVIGVLSVVGGGVDVLGKYYDIPGVAFQVGCHLTAGEGNYDASGNLVTAPDVVNINEIGLFDEDHIMILYGIFAKYPKNNTLTLKVNSVAMLKTLDYQLALLPTTSSTTSSTTSLSTSSLSSSTITVL